MANAASIAHALWRGDNEILTSQQTAQEIRAEASTKSPHDGASARSTYAKALNFTVPHFRASLAMDKIRLTAFKLGLPKWFSKITRPGTVQEEEEEEEEEDDEDEKFKDESNCLGLLNGWRGMEGELFSEVCQTENKKFQYVISPDNGFKKYWDMLISLLVLYNGMKIPFDIGFGKSEQYVEPNALKIFDWSVDGLFLFDIFLTFRTGFHDKEGLPVLDPSRIRTRYLASTFLIDFVATFPFEILLKLLSTVKIATIVLQLFKVPRMLRLQRLLKKTNTITAANVLRICKLLLFFVLLAHWVACCWYLLGSTEGDDSWLVAYRLICSEADKKFGCQNVSVEEQYVAAFYWALTTMTTVGYGDISPQTSRERICTIFVYVVGAVVYSSIFANVSMLLEKFDASGQRYRVKINAVNEMLRFYEVPSELADRVKGNVEYYWSLSGGFDLHVVLDSLPLALRIDVCMSMYEKVVRKVPMFQSLDRALIAEMVIRLHPQAALPGEFVFREGDIGSEMWFVGRGMLHVTNETGDRIFNTIHAGAMFGENVLFFGRRRLASVRAANYVELYSITKDDFENIMVSFPDERAYMERVAEATRQKRAITRKQLKRSPEEWEVNGNDEMRVSSSGPDVRSEGLDTKIDDAECAGRSENLGSSSSTADQNSKEKEGQHPEIQTELNLPNSPNPSNQHGEDAATRDTSHEHLAPPAASQALPTTSKEIEIVPSRDPMVGTYTPSVREAASCSAADAGEPPVTPSTTPQNDTIMLLKAALAKLHATERSLQKRLQMHLQSMDIKIDNTVNEVLRLRRERSHEEDSNPICQEPS
ncbi:hypothetical protein CYMTET_25921 [Cymbomonas tetramitiformis]|uniref:Cyclic nucleotide-binding domain-containing protein n=1 Tax=Cymbomonas tetramitiformis TaxID=36881 RepID=A0AAE0FT91_9CHLO|nr:hypothetical protein CYMTET_25921 [Cymbomonas tetramitiformis]